MPPSQVTIWLQKLDSCRQPLGGAIFEVTGNGIHEIIGPTPGGTPMEEPSWGNCPLQQGDCLTISTGCLSVSLPVVAGETTTYLITEIQAPPGYVPCLGSGQCPAQPPMAVVTINADGKVSAQTHMPFTNDQVKIFPTNRSGFTASQTDPILFYDTKQGNNR